MPTADHFSAHPETFDSIYRHDNHKKYSPMKDINMNFPHNNTYTTSFDVAEAARTKLAEHYEFSRTDNSIRRLVLLSNMLKSVSQQPSDRGTATPMTALATDPEKQKMAQSWFDSCIDDLIQEDDSDQPTAPILYKPISSAVNPEWLPTFEPIELDDDLDEDDESLIDETDIPQLCSSASSDDSFWSNDDLYDNF
ncbi:hypothetical protein INT43_000523 [Umbelopsis isabellina]|uniref:Uncharacterized protein n=1 Tax=Mortierella isabellina TaxID=91625 RepID=A0A8H7UMU7_MORIS|nr:hypothetical protein INT43_000523 [Umbelopsis isabellina]